MSPGSVPPHLEYFLNALLHLVRTLIEQHLLVIYARHAQVLPSGGKELLDINGV